MARATAAQWAKRVANWRDSGLTAKEFATETGVKASTLTYWGWRLGTTKASPTRVASAGKENGADRTALTRDVARSRCEPAMQLVEIALDDVASSSSAMSTPVMLELVVSGDVTVRVPRHFDEDTLKRVMRALR